MKNGAARNRAVRAVGLSMLVGAGLLSGLLPAGAETALLNVSYDPTRELYREINAAFAEAWKAKTGEAITVRASHGGSGAQARTVIDGVDADVVTLGIPSDIDAIAKLTKKIPADWRTKLPNDALPYTSTVVFLVRKGNPKGVKDWADLDQARHQGHHPEPEDLGRRTLELPRRLGLRLRPGQGRRQGRRLRRPVYKNVPVLDTGARGSTVTFAQRGLGDVLPTWENEAYLVLQEFGADKFDIVVPPTSIYAEPPVALVDANVDRKGTRKQAEAYLALPLHRQGAGDLRQAPLPPDQAARPRPEADLAQLPEIKLFKIEDLQGYWDDIQKRNFDTGGLFDQLSKAGR